MSYQTTIAAETNLAYSFKMENPSGDDIDAVGGSEHIQGGGGVTQGASASFPGGWTGLAGSPTCWSFSGSTGGAFSVNALGLLAVPVLTVEFLGYWNTNNNTDDHLLMELTTNFNTQEGFIINGNPSSGTAQRDVGFSHDSGPSKYTLDFFPQPSAATWHHQMYVFDRATPQNKVIIDGGSQTLTTDVHDAATYGNFPAVNLYIMCRNISSLMGAGKMSQLALYTADKSSVAGAHYAALTGSAARAPAMTMLGVGRTMIPIGPRHRVRRLEPRAVLLGDGPALL